MGYFRLAKTFEVEYGHRLSKHPEKCRFPHGHSLRVDVVVRGRELDEHDMVCDFKAIKYLVSDIIDRLDHGMALNSADPELDALQAIGDRVILFDRVDPTSEVVARWIYLELAQRLRDADVVASPTGVKYSVPSGLKLERVRVWETRTSWGEYVGIES
jgi:6-pyruvoyltetrahydropterin/6-carboxytetrahydropterin synthase